MVDYIPPFKRQQKLSWKMYISNSIQKRGSTWDLRFSKQWPWRWHEGQCCLTYFLMFQGKRWANWEKWYHDWGPKFNHLKDPIFFLCPLYSYWFAQRPDPTTPTPCVRTIFCTHSFNYNVACGSIWVWNLVSNIKGGTQTESVWGEYLDQRGMKWQEVGESCITRSFITRTLLQVKLEWSSEEGWHGRGM
jgi:hypothetical protein